MDATESRLHALARHLHRLAACRRCPRMTGPPVLGEAVLSPVLLVGQAPGVREVEQGRPFVGPAGRTLFAWLAPLGLSEVKFRRRVYMAAVCRCFPGKTAGGSDRAPSRAEQAACAPWLAQELDILRPRLILPVGRLAIDRFLGPAPLEQVVGQVHPWREGDLAADLIPLPHPSGASPWPRKEPGKTLLARALELLAVHPAWRAILHQPPPLAFDKAGADGEDGAP